MDCERAANKYKQVEFMEDFVGDDFEAVISGVASFGFWAETVEHKCEGMVPVHELMDFDNFMFMESEYALVGMKTGLRFAMGDKVKVRVVATNLDRRQIDFAVLELPEGKAVPAGRKPALKGTENAPRGAKPAGKKSAPRGGDKPKAGGASKGGRTSRKK